MIKPKTKTNIILASTSVTRKAQLEKLGIPFSTQSPICDETPIIGEFASETALRLAQSKAQSLRSQNPNTLIIGADQVALLNGIQLGKPMSVGLARVMLANMSGQTIEFYSALSLLNTDTRTIHTHVDLTCVTLRSLTKEQIDRYLEKEPDAIYCAGAAKSEGLGASLIERIDSVDPNALLGLPIFKLVEFLQKEGISVL